MSEHLSRNPASTDSGKPDTAASFPSRAPRKRLTREERAPEARASIFKAAAKVVGEHGYAGASLIRIAEAAGIAQGTFYLYFDSKQTLFDELLPHVGKDMVDFVRQRVKGITSVIEMEERGLRAFFEYLQLNPSFFRILNEAETAAPTAYERHFNETASHFLNALKRGIRTGEIRTFDEEDLEALVYVFMATRTYLYLRYMKGAPPGSTVPEKAIAAYMRLVRDGLK